ncbi:MAG: acyltransferase [Chloroflexi bacterium]|nr:acyltransferase [Chloroflexota bacterium]
MPRFGLLASRLVATLPDWHRVGPYWRVVRAMRRRTLRMAGVSVGNSVTIHEQVHIDRRVAVTIGDRVDLRDRVRIGIAESGERAGQLDIGAGTVILSDTQIDCSAWVRVGSGTHVGRRAQIFTHSHDTSRRDVPVLNAPITVAPVSIGDDVMIYNDVVILPGVTIGNGAVVAIRSVVTRDVAPYAIVAGSPARVVGTRG